MWILYLEGKELVRNVFEGASGQWLDCRREEVTQNKRMNENEEEKGHTFVKIFAHKLTRNNIIT